MTFYQRSAEKRKASAEYGPELGEIEGNSSPSHVSSDPKHMENEKRLRREIANSNERRRMQSINTGFDQLKVLVPHQDGEKLSKASILLHTSNFIKSLLKEKSRLMCQNAQYRAMLQKLGVVLPPEEPVEESPSPKRVKRDTECSDEGISLSGNEAIDSDEDRRQRQMNERELSWHRELAELRSQLDDERRVRLILEDRTRQLEASMVTYASSSQPHLPAVPEPEPKQAPAPVQPARQSLPPMAEVARQHVEARTVKHEPAHIKQEHQVWNPVAQPVVVEYIHASESKMPPPRTQEMHVMQPAQAPSSPEISEEEATSMSRRNLETIVKAIRHLEGDMLPDFGGEETVTTEPEERPSDCCGRVSPASSGSPGSSPPRTTTATASIAIAPNVLPLQTSLLHAAFPHQFVARPGPAAYTSS